LSAGSSVLEIEYALEGLPLHAELHLAVEMNFAGIPAGASDRYFTADGARLGQVETELDLRQIDRVGLVDEWLGLGVTMRFARPAGIWTFPIQTVSQSESGFELVHQSAAVLPHWTVRPDATGRWQSSFTLHLDTTTVKAREQRLPVAVG
jgi:alpha-amylase